MTLREMIARSYQALEKITSTALSSLTGFTSHFVIKLGLPHLPNSDEDKKDIYAAGQLSNFLFNRAHKAFPLSQPVVL